jgi:hypothetical protein
MPMTTMKMVDENYNIYDEDQTDVDEDWWQWLFLTPTHVDFFKFYFFLFF